MSNCLNCPTQHPAYSGVTINITNPSVNVPPAGSNVCCHCQSAQNSGCTLPLSDQMYQTVPQISIPPQVSQNYGATQGDMITTSQNAHNSPLKTAKDEVATDRVSGDYNSGTQNINNTNIYQTLPQSNSGLPNVYPKQYYLNNYGNSDKELSNIPNHNAANDFVPSAYNMSENGIHAHNTDTSKEIISELDMRQAEQKEIEKNSKRTKVVSLTNEYIMSLENYLNNPNVDIRLMAAKEVLTRLDEDKTRYDDAALNALLNKMLQDPDKIIRIAAMSALSSELACGNDYTVHILTKIQQNPDADPEDVLEASQILLKRSTTTEVKYSPVYHQEQKVENQS